MNKLDEYILFKIAKSIGSDYKSLFNFLLTQRHLVNYLRIYESAVEELKNQIIIRVEKPKIIYHILPNGKKHGEYKMWFDNGNLYRQCFYKDDKLEGEFKTWWGNGELLFQCSCKDGNNVFTRTIS